MRSLSKIADYEFQKPDLLREALTHPSLDKGESYQRLEFLGDRVLGLVISKTLFEKFPNEAEGKLNRRFSALVRREAVAEVASRLQLDRLILMSEGADAEGSRTKVSVLGDVGEAVIGAIYMDGGFDAASDFVLTHWKPLLDAGAKSVKDAKTELQEWAQARALDLPKYEVISRDGPDHNPVFTIQVVVEDNGTAQAEASSKRVAEQKAARTLLDQLNRT